MSQAIARYASTLFELANSEKNLAVVEKDAAALMNAFAASNDLRNAMKSPLYATADKIAALTQICAKLKASKILVNFVSVVAANGRSGELPAMFKEFLEKSASARGVVNAKIETAAALNNEQIGELSNSLGRALGKQVEVETSIKPELLGGLVVKIGSVLFDDSIKSKLDRLKISLKGI
ncbi:MAG: F-type H+-transporting ATPase subunit delta [Hyphomonadaceae bacterium]|nr:MAG: F-type H+-transporting ATPase subunit delta [Hyphomonadaceae bacterium]KAF0187201.1 MAG: F-type H+-transporting ATPase subunit delta [Hyphomonadaceae bacterium]